MPFPRLCKPMKADGQAGTWHAFRLRQLDKLCSLCNQGLMNGKGFKLCLQRASAPGSCA